MYISLMYISLTQILLIVLQNLITLFFYLIKLSVFKSGVHKFKQNYKDNCRDWGGDSVVKILAVYAGGLEFRSPELL